MFQNFEVQVVSKSISWATSRNYFWFYLFLFFLIFKVVMIISISKIRYAKIHYISVIVLHLLKWFKRLKHIVRHTLNTCENDENLTFDYSHSKLVFHISYLVTLEFRQLRELSGTWLSCFAVKKWNCFLLAEHSG